MAEKPKQSEIQNAVEAEKYTLMLGFVKTLVP